MEDYLTYNVLIVISAYLLGAIPSAVWLGKWMYGKDVRDHGSKNAGATNTFRVLGKKAGIPVLLFDIFKGWLATTGLSYISFYASGTEHYVNLQIACGVSAVIGHIFPVFASFKGGKGVATSLGVVFSLHWQAALVCLAIFLIVFLVSKFVSLGAITAAFAFPFVVIMVFKTPFESLIYFSMIFAIIVIMTHQKNIQRLANREENKMKLKKT